MRRAEEQPSPADGATPCPECVTDRIMQDVLDLSAPRGRRVGTVGHDAAADFLRHRMAEVGLEPLTGEAFDLQHSVPHPSTGKPVGVLNLAGVLRGRRPGARPLLVGAHYDSALDAPCSDDNAASVAVILAAVGELARITCERDLVVVFFDAEERPFFGTEAMGSELFCMHHLSAVDPALAVVLDVIGHRFSSGLEVLDRLFPRIGEFLFVSGCESSESLPGLLLSASADPGETRPIATLSRYIGDVSDDLAFRRAGLPCLFLSAGPTEYHHTRDDVPSRISPDRIRAATGLLVRLLHRVDVSPPGRDEVLCDPVDLEIGTLRRAVGWPLRLLLFVLGIDYPCTREDLDGIAGMVRDRMGIRAR